MDYIKSYTPSDFYNDIYEFNDICKSFDQSLVKEKIKLYVDLVKEETKELSDAYDENDPKELLDGCVDVLVTAFGLLQVLNAAGMNTSKALQDTAENNLSKFPSFADIGNKEYCELVEDTRALYEQKGVTVDYNPSSNDERLVFTNAVTGKVLKPHNYKPNDLSSCVNGVQIK